MQRCVIIGGADIGNYAAVRRSLMPDDFYIYCDCGLKHLHALGKTPGLIVGDFDSFSNPGLAVETIVLPREKDDTDTVFAVREAMRRGFTEFLLIGVVGQRLDHTLGNIAILAMLHSHGCRGKIIDDYSDMELVAGGDTVSVSDDYPFFSLLALGGNAEGVTIKNAKYELSDALLTTDYPYGVSNEPIPGKRAEISLRSGRMLLIKVFG